MTIFTDGMRLEGDRPVTDFTTSWTQSLGASASQVLADSPTAQLSGIMETDRAAGRDIDFGQAATGMPTPGFVQQDPSTIPAVPKAEAAERIKAAGVDLKLPDQDAIAAPVLDIMINRARDRRELEATIQRGPQNALMTATSIGTSFLVGAIDPLNLASAFVPVMGELRYAKILAGAGDSFAGRTAVRLAKGAAEGVVGQAALEPLDWYSHTQDGRDFGMADVLQNLVFGGALGAGFHAGGGGVRDAYRARRGLVQYPFGPGEPLEHVDGIHVPERVLTEDGVAHTDLPAHLQPVLNTIDQVLADSPAMAMLRDLPPRAQEDSMRAALASMIDGEPVKVSEMLQAAAETDPRIAESFEAWHGSPHSFDRFDASKMGSGEGAQSYGHGLYFAQNETVALTYRRQTSDKAFVNKVAEIYDEGFSPDDAWGEIKDHWKEFTPAEQRLMTALEKDDWLGFDYPHQAVRAALRDIKGYDVSRETADAAKAVGNMYRVKIAADHEHFLDWDKPLGEQRQHVRDAVAGIVHDHSAFGGGRISGGDVYHLIASELATHKKGTPDRNGFYRMDDGRASASRALAEAGVPGIKYFNKGSRDAGEGTRNFVVFDDKHVEIIDRNGEPVAKPFTQAPAGDPKIVLGPDAVTAPKPRGRGAASPDTLSLNEHLASKGGLRPDPELAAVYGGKNPFLPGFGPLIRKSGMTLDEALSSAKQHGYMFDPHDVDGGAGAGGRTSMGLTPRDLLDHLDNENRGQKLYKPGHAEATKYDAEQERHVVLGHVETEFEAAGLKISDIDGKLLDRTVEIVHREGESDVLAAYERAIIEDADRYEAIANARDAAEQHPARDVPYDAGAAPGRGGSGAVDGGAAGRSGPGERGADSAQSSRDGAGDIGARFRELAATQPDVNDPDLIAASKAAANLPEPIITKLDERVSAAEKADNFAKQMYDMFADRLPPEERQRLDDAIRKIDDDAAVRQEAIERSGACLFGARS